MDHGACISHFISQLPLFAYIGLKNEKIKALPDLKNANKTTKLRRGGIDWVCGCM